MSSVNTARLDGCPLCADAVLAHTEAVHRARRGSFPTDLQQPGQGGGLAPVIRGHGPLLQR